MPHVWPGGIEPPISCSRSTRLATRLWPVGGPLRTRTGNLLLAGELLLPIGASSPRDYLFSAIGSQGQAFPGCGHPAPGNRPASFNCVPLCSCQLAGTYTHRAVLRMDGRNRTCNYWIWRPVLFLVELRPYVHVHKTARRAYPRERLPVDACASIQKPPRRPGSGTAARTRA